MIDQRELRSVLSSLSHELCRPLTSLKAGFDLRERFTVQIDERTQRVRADFPAPKILSVEQNSYKVVNDDSGYWNRLTQKDQELAVNDMNAKARAEALEMQVREEAKASLRRQLLELAKKSGQTWEITFRDELQPVAQPRDAKL